MTQTLEAPAKEYINNIRFELGVSASTQSLGRPNARLFIKAKNAIGEKQIGYFYFPTEQARQNWIDIKTKEAADRCASAAKHAAETKAAKANFTNPYKVGDILVDSWGYDQTNIDFYQVTAVTAKGIKFRALCAAQADVNQEGYSPMSDHVVPVKDSFKTNSKEEFRAVSVYTHNDKVNYGISYNDHSLRPWDGKPQYRSWYA